MDVVLIVQKGLEQAQAAHIQELIDISHLKIHAESVQFSCSSFDDLIALTYRDQIASQILLVLGSVDLQKSKEHSKNQTAEESKIEEKVMDKHLHEQCKTAYVKLAKDFLPITSFCVRCSIAGFDTVDVQEIEREIGSVMHGIITHANKQYASTDPTIPDTPPLRVDLKNPQLTILIYAADPSGKLFIGIDFSGDLSKRDYKIFNNAKSIKGTTAFGFLKIAGYTAKDTMLDMLCNDGVIAIEAGLYATHTSPRRYSRDFACTKFLKYTFEDYAKIYERLDRKQLDKSAAKIIATDPLLRNLTAAKKNAKIAGIEKSIEFRRIDLDWLDVKFEKKSISKIITFIPGSAHYDKNLIKSIEQIFYHAEYILKDNGLLSIMCIRKDILVDASKKYFTLTDEKTIWSGHQSLTILLFKKTIDNVEDGKWQEPK